MLRENPKLFIWSTIENNFCGKGNWVSDSYVFLFFVQNWILNKMTNSDFEITHFNKILKFSYIFLKESYKEKSWKSMDLLELKATFPAGKNSFKTNVVKIKHVQNNLKNLFLVVPVSSFIIFRENLIFLKKPWIFMKIKDFGIFKV